MGLSQWMQQRGSILLDQWSPLAHKVGVKLRETAWQKTESVDTALVGHTTTTGHKRSGPASVIGTGTMSTIKTVINSVFAKKNFPQNLIQTHLPSVLKLVTCQKIENPRSRVGSFKVTAECKDIGEMYTSELWP